MNPIPFNRPALLGNEFTYMSQAIQAGHASGNGPFTKRCEALLEQLLGVSHVLLTSSCTHALEMAALLLHIRPGDDVIVPSFTFVSTANAFVLRGARPAFVDIRPDTLNLDERQVEAAITARAPSWRCTMPESAAGWTPWPTWRSATSWSLSRTMRTACSGAGAAATWGRLARWRR